MSFIFNHFLKFIVGVGEALFFLLDVVKYIILGRIRWSEVLKQIFEQGIQSVVIICLTSMASGAVLALQSYVMLNRFGSKELVAQLVALSLVRELSPVFSSFVFTGKVGARITAELGTMKVNDQLTATRAMGVDPVEFLVVPRMVACFLVLPGLVVLSEVVGIWGGYMVGVYSAGISSSTYIHQTLSAIGMVDFFSGFIKTFFFALLISWVACYQGFKTSGGSLGVGQYTTKAVALSYILVVVSNVFITKIILAFWG